MQLISSNMKVQILNINNGERIETYAPVVPVVCSNGPAARRVQFGDDGHHAYCTMTPKKPTTNLLFPDTATNSSPDPVLKTHRLNILKFSSCGIRCMLYRVITKT